MDSFFQLDDTWKDRALRFLSRRPEANLILLHNMTVFGLEEGDEPLSGHYFGRASGGELVSAGSAYGVGSMFFWCAEHRYARGLGGYLAEHRFLPSFMSGDAVQVEIVLGELAGLLEVEVRAFPSELMVLRGRPATAPAHPRPTTFDDMGAILEMQRAMDEELFGPGGFDPLDAAGVLGWQVERGYAYVVEEEGRVVAKAEATVLPGTGGQLSGVFTVPGSRGRGHAEACVGALCARVMEDAGFVTLTVDRDNFKAAGLYHRIGFRKTGDHEVARLVKPAGADLEV